MVRTRDPSGVGPDQASQSEARDPNLIFPSENERPTREYAVPPTLRDESTVHRAPTREFPAHIDPTEAFARVEQAHVDGAACIDADKASATERRFPGSRRSE